MILLNYIKYLFALICIVVLLLCFNYIIQNEKQKARLQLQNQTLNISNQTIEKDFEKQKKITKYYSIQVNNEKKINNLVNNIKININTKSIIELNKILNCELENFNNIEIVCQK